MSVEELVEWVVAHEGYVSPHVEFKRISPHNIGAFYTNGGENANEPQVKLPVKLIITPANARASFNITNGSNSLLKLYLARERTAKFISRSFYSKYLSLLPKLADIDTPYVWNAEDRALIKGTNLGNSLKENLLKLVEEWWTIVNQLPDELEKPNEHFINMKFYYEAKFYTDDDFYKYFAEENVDNWTSFPNYLWASIILKSRSFPAYLLSDSEFKQDEAMLLPLVDLLNHSPRAKVNWSVSDSFFNFKSDSLPSSGELFNNYGRKGNEELLLAYGFVLENNESDSSALKIKVPAELLPELEKNGVKLPSISDYTSSVVETSSQVKDETTSDYKQYEDGLLFYITKDHIPENLVLLFQWLVKNKWETKLTLRMKLAGVNQLRQALDTKHLALSAITVPKDSSQHYHNIRVYVESQRQIFSASIKNLKRIEKELLADKKRFLTLKNVYKKDIKFLQALLVTLGVTSYETILENELQDQIWLLYLMRCYNRDEYIQSDEDEEENYLPKWIQEAFVRLSKETKIKASEIVSYKELYEGLIIPLNQAVPEIFNKGKWEVDQMIIAAKLLDLIGFVRGKDQECIVVSPL